MCARYVMFIGRDHLSQMFGVEVTTVPKFVGGLLFDILFGVADRKRLKKKVGNRQCCTEPKSFSYIEP